MQLNFPIIDPHIHQWDPYHTPHAAALAVKLFGRHPHLLDRMVRLFNPKPIVDTVGLTEHITAPYLPETTNGISGIIRSNKWCILKPAGMNRKVLA